MSKPKRRTPQLPPSNPKSGSSGTTGKPRNRRGVASTSNSWLLIVIIVLAVLVLAVGGFWLSSSATPASTPKPAIKVSQPTHVGSVDCEEIPKFVQDLHFTTGTAFSTSERGVKGLALVVNPVGGTGQNKIYQKPTWTIAGQLAPIQFGKSGTLFVAPAPSINVLDNPADKQNDIYHVDSGSGDMALFVSLPRAAPATPENPFGILGLGYDCTTNKLYASTVAGSTLNQEVGRLYELDADKATVLSEHDAVDAIGMAVFDGAKGKRLYYGLARWPEIWSIGLGSDGSFQGQPRLEISLAGLGPRGSDKARRITFSPNNQMVVSGIEFSFNLIAPTEKQETTYTFRYDDQTDKWVQLS